MNKIDGGQEEGPSSLQKISGRLITFLTEDYRRQLTDVLENVTLKKIDTFMLIAAAKTENSHHFKEMMAVFSKRQIEVCHALVNKICWRLVDGKLGQTFQEILEEKDDVGVDKEEEDGECYNTEDPGLRRRLNFSVSSQDEVGVDKEVVKEECYEIGVDKEVVEGECYEVGVDKEVVKEECYEVGVDKEVDEVESATALPSEEIRRVKLHRKGKQEEKEINCSCKEKNRCRTCHCVKAKQPCTPKCSCWERGTCENVSFKIICKCIKGKCLSCVCVRENRPCTMRCACWGKGNCKNG